MTNHSDWNQQYWQQRLSDQFGLAGTGHRAFGAQYNRTLYRAMLNCVEDICIRNGVSIPGKRVLDVGCGTGFWIAHWLDAGASQVYGLDVTQVSVERLIQRFPSGCFARADVCDEIPFDGEFDLISAINVLFHITDDTRFLQAMENICASLAPQGFLVVTDSFQRSRLILAKHVKPRPLLSYESGFEQFRVRVLEVMPVFYLLDRSFIPYLGPWLIQRLGLTEVFYRIDRRLRERGRSNGMGLKVLIARRDRVSTSEHGTR